MPRHDPVPRRRPADRRPAERQPLDQLLTEQPPVDRTAELRRRQRSRSIVTAVILFALVGLFYAISLAKMM